jgi:hypothetical protein
MAPNRRTARWAAAGLLLAAALAAGWVLLDRFDPPPVTPRLVSAPARVSKAEPTEVAVGRSLRAVRPGMPRAEVELALGPPDPARISPLVRDGERAVYRTRYPAVLTEPTWCAPGLLGPCEAVLEFDATQTGHPLLGIVCTPPAPPAAPPVGAIPVT